MSVFILTVGDREFLVGEHFRSLAVASSFAGFNVSQNFNGSLDKIKIKSLTIKRDKTSIQEPHFMTL